MSPWARERQTAAGSADPDTDGGYAWGGVGKEAWREERARGTGGGSWKILETWDLDLLFWVWVAARPRLERERGGEMGRSWRR